MVDIVDVRGAKSSDKPKIWRLSECVKKKLKKNGNGHYLRQFIRGVRGDIWDFELGNTSVVTVNGEIVTVSFARMDCEDTQRYEYLLKVPPGSLGEIGTFGDPKYRRRGFGWLASASSVNVLIENEKMFAGYTVAEDNEGGIGLGDSLARDSDYPIIGGGRIEVVQNVFEKGQEVEQKLSRLLHAYRLPLEIIPNDELLELHAERFMP
ncbi:MAG: hypothetical protein FWE31_04330 [Firmicutes bacterium]|nr:hypothetical protein [Bacillota bacterium]